MGIAEWGKRFLPHYFKVTPPGLHHRWFAAEMERAFSQRGARIGIAAPRSFAKSTWWSLLFPLYAICHAKEKYIILIADTSEQANLYLRHVKDELDGNALLKAFYPEACGVGARWTDDSIITRNGVRVEALGTGKDIRGRREHEHRPTLIIVDDPQKGEVAYSSVQRDHDWDWFVKDVLKAGSAETNIVVPGTVIHPSCIVAKVLDWPGWRSARFQAITSWPERMDLWAKWERILCDAQNPDCEADAANFYQQHKKTMDAGAKVLWEAWRNLYSLMVQRATEGHASFESEFQNNPIDPTKCEWSPELFAGDLWYDELPRGACDIKVLACDPSKGRGSEDKPGCYSAIVRVSKYGSLYYVEADLQRRTDDVIPRDFLAHYYEFQPDVSGVEAIAFQSLFVQIIEDEAAKRGLPIKVVPLEDNTNKDVRIRRLNGPVCSRAFRFKRHSPGTALLFQQLSQFPTADFKDGPDALEMCWRMICLALMPGGEQEAFVEQAQPTEYVDV